MMLDVCFFKSVWDDEINVLLILVVLWKICCGMVDVGSGEIDLDNLIWWLLWLGDMDGGIELLRIILFFMLVLVGKCIWAELEESALGMVVCIILLFKVDFVWLIGRGDAGFKNFVVLLLIL